MSRGTRGERQAALCAWISLILAAATTMAIAVAGVKYARELGPIVFIVIGVVMIMNFFAELCIFSAMWRNPDTAVYIGRKVHASKLIPLDTSVEIVARTEPPFDMEQGTSSAIIRERITCDNFTYDRPVSNVGSTLFMQTATIRIYSEFDDESAVAERMTTILHILYPTKDTMISGDDYDVRLIVFGSRLSLALFTAAACVPLLRASIWSWYEYQRKHRELAITIVRRIH